MKSKKTTFSLEKNNSISEEGKLLIPIFETATEMISFYFCRLVRRTPMNHRPDILKIRVHSCGKLGCIGIELAGQDTILYWIHGMNHSLARFYEYIDLKRNKMCYICITKSLKKDVSF